MSMSITMKKARDWMEEYDKTLLSTDTRFNDSFVVLHQDSFCFIRNAFAIIHGDYLCVFAEHVANQIYHVDEINFYGKVMDYKL